jgi:hypothetical protein
MLGGGYDETSNLATENADVVEKMQNTLDNIRNNIHFYIEK